MADLSPTTLITTLNVNGLNNPVKRQRLSVWIKKPICCPQKTHFRFKDINRFKVKG